MLDLIATMTRNMPNIPYRTQLIKPLTRIRSRRQHVIKDFLKCMRLKLDVNYEMQSKVFWYGYHHLEESKFLSRYLRANHVFIDIGANFGEFTLIAANTIKAGKIFAFEPDPIMYSKLEYNCSINNISNVRLFNCGLSDTTIEGDLYSPPENSSIHEGLLSLKPLSTTAPCSHVKVQLIRLDDVQEIFESDRVDLIKVDVEGAELNVLQGSISIIRKFKPALILEINESRFIEFGYSTSQLLKFVNHLNPYRYFLFHIDGGLIPISQDELIDIVVSGKRDCFNILCL